MLSLSFKALPTLVSSQKRCLSTSNSPLLRFILSRAYHQASKKAPLLTQLPKEASRTILKKPNLFSPINDEVYSRMFGTAFIKHKAVGYWFAGIAFMCAGAVVIGGITRLTESGLSMTSWHLIKDIKRPQTEDEWAAEFARYKTFPEFETVHCNITLEKFKSIFFWEWFHRNWGRSIGLFYLLPLFYFWKRKKFDKLIFPIYRHPFNLMVLLGAQGLYGWYMVQSGLDKKNLEDRLDSNIARVSPYRLAGHLTLALLLFSGCAVNAMQCLYEPKPLIFPQLEAFNEKYLNLTKSARKLKRMTPSMAIGMVSLSILSGAFVAGLDAGMIYNNWPKMADEGVFHLPRDVFAHKPLWRDLLENPATVQLEHRIITHATFFGLMAICLRGYKCRSVLPRSVQFSLLAVFTASLTQVLLGINAIKTQCPLEVCSLHQTGSVTLLTSCLALHHFLRRIPK